ncbi:MAG: hypothetical protein V4692_07870 [Bdellovibrionota bacterium]
MHFVVSMIVSFFVFTSIASAQTQVLDPKNLLPAARDFVGGQTNFESAFRCGDHVSYRAHVISCEEVRCEGAMCWQACSHIEDPAGIIVDRSVVNCSDSGAQIFTDANGDLTDVLKSDFEVGRTAFDWFLRDLGRFTTYTAATVHIKSTEPTTFTLARGTPNERKVDALNIYGEFGEEKMARFGFLITVVKAAPGVGQVARFRLGLDITRPRAPDAGGDTWFLLNDIPNDILATPLKGPQ